MLFNIDCSFWTQIFWALHKPKNRPHRAGKNITFQSFFRTWRQEILFWREEAKVFHVKFTSKKSNEHSFWEKGYADRNSFDTSPWRTKLSTSKDKFCPCIFASRTRIARYHLNRELQWSYDNKQFVCRRRFGTKYRRGIRCKQRNRKLHPETRGMFIKVVVIGYTACRKNRDF